MAVVLDPEQWLGRLTDRITTQRSRIARWDAYYEGTQPLSYLAPELVVEMGDRLRPVVINWPRLVADSIEERENIEGFRLARRADADADMWRIWQANDLDEESSRAHVESLVMGRSYVIVGGNEAEPETPLITVESPMDVYVEPDPRTREAAAAVKLWQEQPVSGAPIEHATLYLPDTTSWWIKDGGKWVPDGDYPPDEHRLGQVPVVALLNRSRIRNRLGVSELADVVPLSDAACKIATDMLVSAEFHAMPRRYAIGLAAQDFVDANGNPLSSWSAVAGRLWATDKTSQDGAPVQIGQFPEANLTNFHETLNALARLVASMSGLDPAALGFTTTAPASADAIRSAESRLIKRVRRKMRTLGGGWEAAMRIADQMATGVRRPELRSMETIWADPETPTVAQAADAAVKKYAAGIVPLRQTREDLDYTVTQIERMEEQDEEALAASKVPTAAEMLIAGRPAPAPEPPEPGEPADGTGAAA